MEQPLVAEATPEGAFVAPWSGMGILCPYKPRIFLAGFVVSIVGV